MIFEGTKKSIFFGLGLTRAGNGYPETQEILPLQQYGINNIIYILLLNMEYLYG